MIPEELRKEVSENSVRCAPYHAPLRLPNQAQLVAHVRIHREAISRKQKALTVATR